LKQLFPFPLHRNFVKVVSEELIGQKYGKYALHFLAAHNAECKLIKLFGNFILMSFYSLILATLALLLLNDPLFLTFLAQRTPRVLKLVLNSP
jgi:hypothetical protein